MRSVAQSLAIVASIVTLSGSAPPSAQRREAPDEEALLASLRAAEAAVAERTRAEDGFALDGSRGSPQLLEAQWTAVRRWTAAWLDDHPDASAADLIAAAKSGPGLDLSTVSLDRASLLVSAEAGALGTAFVLHRGVDGRYLTATALYEPNTWGGGGPPELAAWRSDRAAAGCRDHRPQADWAICGPLAPSLTRLQDEADGGRRFAVVGRYVKEAGATDAYQLSIWRWTGHAAEPLLAYTLDQMADEPVIAAVSSSKLTVHEKGDFKRMFACGGCSGRQMEVVFTLPSRGAVLARTRSLVPDLDAVDDLYDRLFQSESTDRLASPAVVAALTPKVEALRAEARRRKLDPSLGMLMNWKATGASLSTLCLSTDALDTSQLFTLGPLGAIPRITAVKNGAPTACEGPDSHS